MNEQVIQSMSPVDVQKWLERHPKPWKVNNSLFGRTYILDGATNEIDADDLAAYALFLERRENAYCYCYFCQRGMLEGEPEFTDSWDIVHCSQECLDKAEAQR